MTEKIKNIAVILSAAAFIVIAAVWSIAAPDGGYLESERRRSSELPEADLGSIMEGGFMRDVGAYAADRLPLRPQLRKLKACVSFYALGPRDDNGVFIAEGFASRLDYPLDEDSVAHAADRFQYVYDSFLRDSGSDAYIAVIPDKSYYLAEKNGYPSLDFDALCDSLCSRTDFAQRIDIAQLLEAEDYYRTDTHWRQEKIMDAARHIAAEMGVTLTADYTVTELDEPFYGVYFGQAAIPLEPDRICYLQNDTLRGCVVYDYESGAEMPVYDMEKAHGSDPYEIFLSGPKPLISIKNPNASTDKELIVFRDSFGSSLAPLLAEGYAEITLVDIRYIMPQLLPRFIDFHGQDVLFIYSAPVLNNSATIK